jgi:hypothetical protein
MPAGNVNVKAERDGILEKNSKCISAAIIR